MMVKAIDINIEVHQPSYNAGWSDCIEELKEREEKLVAALEPFAKVGQLKSVIRHPGAGLWSSNAGGDDSVKITTLDCMKAAATLKELGLTT